MEPRVFFFILSILIAGPLFTTVAEGGLDPVPPMDGCCTCPLEPGCSTTPQNDCPSDCIFINGQVCSDQGICVTQSDPTEPNPIPVLSEWGFIAMAVILGVIGFLIIRKRRAAA